MLKAAEKAQTDRLQRNLRTFQQQTGNHFSAPATPGPRKAAIRQQDDLTPAKTLPPAQLPSDSCDLDEMRTESIPLTLDEIEWLDGAVERHGHSGFSGVFSRLVDWSNTEPPEAKKKLFLVVRCRRCSAGAKGGVKRDHDIMLTARQWQWLEAVRARSKHASIGKTLRIIVDFYMAFCKEDSSFEQKLLRAGAAIKKDRHEDAVNSVDPSRALAIR